MRLNPTAGRGLWMSLLAAAAMVVVILSWMVPEPQQQQRSQPTQRIEPISYTSCSEQGPGYGTRSLSTSREGGCAR